MHKAQSPSGGMDNSISLLAGKDPGSVCLDCHLRAGQKQPDSHLVATADPDMPAGTPPFQLTPAGDFGWLKKSYRWGAGSGEAGGYSPGERHGHNIVADEYRFSSDTERITAPGGTYPSNSLSCISCHDPHGKYRRFAGGSIGTVGAPILASGSYDSSPDPTGDRSVGVYRLLGGKGYKTSLYDSEPFTADPPSAVSPSTYNRKEDLGDTRVAYGAGFSEWCANCHPGLLGSGGAGAKSHPAGNTVKLSRNVVANYNAYVTSGNLSGSSSTSYTSMVPFEAGTSDYGLLKQMAKSDGSSDAGPGPQANVMCLSCHRAHASGWDHAGRWNLKGEFLVFNGQFPGVDDSTVPTRISQGRTRAETRKTFYDRPPTAYASYQRSLCNKCHAKD
ncbi:MAG: cytochrome C [Desulfobacteria bacterium]